MYSGLLIALLQLPLQFAERGELAALEFLDPPLADLMDRDRVEVVQLLAAVLVGGDKVSLLENDEMFRDGLPCHGETLAEVVQRLSVFGVKPVEQRSPRCIG